MTFSVPKGLCLPAKQLADNGNRICMAKRISLHPSQQFSIDLQQIRTMTGHKQTEPAVEYCFVNGSQKTPGAATSEHESDQFFPHEPFASAQKVPGRGKTAARTAGIDSVSEQEEFRRESRPDRCRRFPVENAESSCHPDIRNGQHPAEPVPAPPHQNERKVLSSDLQRRSRISDYADSEKKK